MSVRFRTILQRHHNPTTVLPVPRADMLRLTPRRRVRVQVTLLGYQYRTTIAAGGDWYFIPFGQNRQRHTGITVGDEVEVVVDLDAPPSSIDHSALAAAVPPGAPSGRARNRPTLRR